MLPVTLCQNRAQFAGSSGLADRAVVEATRVYVDALDRRATRVAWFRRTVEDGVSNVASPRFPACLSTMDGYAIVGDALGNQTLAIINATGPN